MNGFRKACLESGKILMMNDVKLNKFEKLLNIKMYKIEHKKNNIEAYLITTVKTLKMKKIAEYYEKYTYGYIGPCKKFLLGQTNMGKALEFINPVNPKNINSSRDSVSFFIFYENKPIFHDIYCQGIIYDKLSQKDLLTIYKKLFIMRKLLKKISHKFRVDIRIGLK